MRPLTVTHPHTTLTLNLSVFRTSVDCTPLSGGKYAYSRLWLHQRLTRCTALCTVIVRHTYMLFSSLPGTVERRCTVLMYAVRCARSVHNLSSFRNVVDCMALCAMHSFVCFYIQECGGLGEVVGGVIVKVSNEDTSDHRSE